VRPAGEDAHLADDVDVTFAVLSRPMLAMLKFFYRLSGNWGVAIILLTIFVKLVTFYPTQRTLLSAKKMQRLAPKIAALRKKYGNDKQKLGVETMNLYKAPRRLAVWRLPAQPDPNAHLDRAVLHAQLRG